MRFRAFRIPYTTTRCLPTTDGPDLFWYVVTHHDGVPVIAELFIQAESIADAIEIFNCLRLAFSNTHSFTPDVVREGKSPTYQNQSALEIVQNLFSQCA